MIAEEVYDLVLDDLFIRLDQLVPGSSVFLKLEGLNPAGSVKLKTAVALVAAAEESGRCFPRTRLIESTSGNLGVALAMVCAAKGYRLTCVTDPNANVQSRRLMEVLGAEVVVIDVRDAHGGYLQSRIDYIGERLRRDPDLLLAEPVRQPGRAAGPPGPHGPCDPRGDRPYRLRLHRGRNDGHPDGLRGVPAPPQPRHPDHRGGRRGLRDLRRAGRPPPHSGPGNEQAPGNTDHRGISTMSCSFPNRLPSRCAGCWPKNAGCCWGARPARFCRRAGRGKGNPGRKCRGGDFTGLRRPLSGDHLQRRMGGGTLARARPATADVSGTCLSRGNLDVQL